MKVFAVIRSRKPLTAPDSPVDYCGFSSNHKRCSHFQALARTKISLATGTSIPGWQSSARNHLQYASSVCIDIHQHSPLPRPVAIAPLSLLKPYYLPQAVFPFRASGFLVIAFLAPKQSSSLSCPFSALEKSQRQRHWERRPRPRQRQSEDKEIHIERDRDNKDESPTTLVPCHFCLTWDPLLPLWQFFVVANTADIIFAWQHLLQWPTKSEEKKKNHIINTK